MNDFLQNLRNQSAAKERRFNKGNKSHDSGVAYHHPERRSGQDRRTRAPRPSGIREETLSGLKSALDALVLTQRDRLMAEERKADAEERKAEAMERLTDRLELLLEQLAAGSAMPVHSAAPVMPDPLEETDDDDDVRKTSRSYILKLIDKMRIEGATYDQIAAFLTENGFPTFSGRGKWHAQTIHRLCQ